MKLLRTTGRTARQRLQAFAGHQALRVARRLNHKIYVPLDYPTSADNRPRWGYGRPPHAGMVEILSRHDDVYREQLEMILGYRDDLATIPVESPTAGPNEPYWRNGWQLGLDGASLYAYVRSLAPPRYLEVGSGMSTLFVDRARRDGALPTTITSIDPTPRVWVDELCDHVVRAPLERVGLEPFRALRAGDMLFVDNSHRVFMNSDVAVFFLEILPELPDGLLLGLHDILWPDDYLPEWDQYFFSEQYLFGVYLLAGLPGLRPLLAGNYVSGHPELAKVLGPLWDDPRLGGVDRRGFVFWAVVDRGGTHVV